MSSTIAASNSSYNYSYGLVPFCQAYFKSAKGVEWIGKAFDVGGQITKIYNPELSVVADSLAQAGKTVQNFCKMGAFPSTLASLFKRVDELRRAIFKLGVWEEAQEVKTSSNGDPIIVKSGIKPAILNIIHGISDGASKMKGVIGVAKIANAKIISKIAADRLTLTGDCFTVLSCSINGYNNTYKLLNNRMTTLEFNSEIISLAINASLVALSSLCIAITFGVLSAPVWAIPALLATYVTTSILSAYHEANIAEAKKTVKSA